MNPQTSDFCNNADWAFNAREMGFGGSAKDPQSRGLLVTGDGEKPTSLSWVAAKPMKASNGRPTYMEHLPLTRRGPLT